MFSDIFPHIFFYNPSVPCQLWGDLWYARGAGLRSLFERSATQRHYRIGTRLHVLDIVMHTAEAHMRSKAIQTDEGFVYGFLYGFVS